MNENNEKKPLDELIGRFRTEHPDWIIINEKEHYDEHSCLFQCIIQDPNGITKQTAHGAYEKSDTVFGRAYVMSAESIAQSRALRFFFGLGITSIENALGEEIGLRLSDKKGESAIEEAIKKIKNKS